MNFLFVLTCAMPANHSDLEPRLCATAEQMYGLLQHERDALPKLTEALNS
jgi:hypothetical protein